MSPLRAAACARRHQRGVYATEFALVFMVSFGLLYAIICYGLLFTFRFAVQYAAEDGARAALRYQPDLAARQAEAIRVANLRIDWLPPLLRDRAGNGAQAELRQADPGVGCGNTWASRCSMVVTVPVSGLHDMLPPFPGFAMPDAIRGQASVLLEGSAL